MCMNLHLNLLPLHILTLIKPDGVFLSSQLVAFWTGRKWYLNAEICRKLGVLWRKFHCLLFIVYLKRSYCLGMRMGREGFVRDKVLACALIQSSKHVLMNLLKYIGSSISMMYKNKQKENFNFWHTNYFDQ